MKQVNLLPASLRKRQQGRVMGVAGGTGLLLGAVCVALIIVPLKVLVNSSNQQIEALAADAAASAANKKPEISADAVQRITQLNALAASEVDWSKAFDLAGSIVPQDITLGNLNYAPAATSGTMTLSITGTAPSNVSFAVFMESLKSNQKITSVAVSGYSFDPATGTVTFSLAATVPLSSIDYSAS